MESRSRSWPSRRLAGAAARLLLAACLLSAAGCGKKGPPLPPLKRGPDRVTGVSLRQLGGRVVVTGVMPERSQDGGAVLPLLEVRIFRLDRPAQAEGASLTGKAAQRMALRQFSREARRIATLTGEMLAKSVAMRRLTFIDPDPAPSLAATESRDLTYAVTVVDTEKRSSPLSPLTTIRLSRPPLPPSNLEAEPSATSIRLRWIPPSSQAGKEPYGYNIYRSEEEGSYPEHPLNEKPLPQPTFDDEHAPFGRTYYYVVRTVVGEKPPYRESEDSTALGVTPMDLYPPSVPTGLAVSAEGGVMKLYWFPNAEPDLAGYRIYRSGKEGEGFEQIGEVGPAETDFVDRGVQPGVKYFYCITAFDTATPPNESGRSMVHGDRLPPPTETPAGSKPPGKG